LQEYLEEPWAHQRDLEEERREDADTWGWTLTGIKQTFESRHSELLVANHNEQ
jgi:hypothetical protein